MATTLSRGVIYCALQQGLYLEAALMSAFALRQLEPDLPIVLLSDLAGWRVWGWSGFT